jgi:hypothetical protein
MVSVFYSNYKDYRDEHVSAVLRYCNRPANRIYKAAKFDAAVKTYFSPHLSDMKSLLEASAETLAKVKKYYDVLPSTTQDLIKTELNLEGLYNYFLQSKFERNDGSVYNSGYLAHRIAIPVCPYCNENYTYRFVYPAHPHFRRSYDWDHIHNKDHYPFFAISFFNLVPSCKVCNFIKLNQNQNFLNPHLEVNTDTLFSFHFGALDLGFLQNEDSIKLFILYYKNTPYYHEIKNTVGMAGLLARFSKHKSLIKDIINRQRIYPPEYLATLPTFSGQIPDPNTASRLRETFFSTVFNHEGYYLRPFSKLTNDILRRLERDLY